jgi:hypothetical protein
MYRRTMLEIQLIHTNNINNVFILFMEVSINTVLYTYIHLRILAMCKLLKNATSTKKVEFRQCHVLAAQTAVVLHIHPYPRAHIHLYS